MVTARKPASDGDFKYELIPSGTHAARCFSVVDLGIQKQDYQGDVSWKRKVRVGFETPDEVLQEEGEFKGQPFSIAKEYTLSLSEKANLRKDLEGWRGQAFTEQELDGFELDALLGKACMINVVHRQSQAGRTYATIVSISKLPKGFEVAAAVNKPLLFDLEAPDAMQKLQELPDWLAKKINPDLSSGSTSQAGTSTAPQGDGLSEEDFDDDIPF